MLFLREWSDFFEKKVKYISKTTLQQVENTKPINIIVPLFPDENVLLTALDINSVKIFKLLA